MIRVIRISPTSRWYELRAVQPETQPQCIFVWADSGTEAVQRLATIETRPVDGASYDGPRRLPAGYGPEPDNETLIVHSDYRTPRRDSAEAFRERVLAAIEVPPVTSDTKDATRYRALRDAAKWSGWGRNGPWWVFKDARFDSMDELADHILTLEDSQ